MPEMLIVEDERVCAMRYTELFESAGYTVRLARTGERALTAFRKRVPDVVLLDVMLPQGDGFGVCAQMRAYDAFVPIVFNTALDCVEDKRRGLELGGDDYVLKTDPPEELLARVDRAVRRHQAFRAASRARDEIVVGPVCIRLSLLEVFAPDGETVRLTRTEADILRLLSSARGRTFGMDEILEATRGEGFACDESLVYVHLANLRRKLGVARQHLVTEKGVGYRLCT